MTTFVDIQREGASTSGQAKTHSGPGGCVETLGWASCMRTCCHKYDQQAQSDRIRKSKSCLKGSIRNMDDANDNDVLLDDPSATSNSPFMSR